MTDKQTKGSKERSEERSGAQIAVEIADENVPVTWTLFIALSIAGDYS